MVSLKRQIYGLPLLGWYRRRRARQLAEQLRTVGEGFALASYDAAFTDDWEQSERALVARLLPDCGALIDVGANNGFYSLLADHLGKPALAVEPDIGNLIILRRNVANADVEIHAVALSDREAMTTLYGDGDMASFDARWQGVGKHFRQTVKTVTLDALLRDRWLGERLLIKVDVEGAEALVLAGAGETLARHPRPYWLIETLTNLPTGAPNPAYADALRIMSSADYDAELVSDGNFLFTQSPERPSMARHA